MSTGQKLLTDADNEKLKHEFQEQDKLITDISDVVKDLKQHATTMGQQLSEHETLIKDIDFDVETGQSKLDRANRRILHILKNKDNCSTCACACFIIIIVIIIILVLLYGNVVK